MSKPLSLPDSFYLFVKLAFLELHGNSLNPNHQYIEYLCYQLAPFIERRVVKMLINLPGRHLKTLLGSVFLPAFMLGLNPKLRFLVVAYDEEIAEDIVGQIRTLMSSTIYKQLFRTQIHPDHRRKDDFRITGGGRVRAAPVSSVTGKGGDVIIFDDPHNVFDWDNPRKKRRVVQLYETLRTRGDRGAMTQFLVVGHRTAADDVFAHIIQGGDFQHVVLPLYAPEDTHLKIGDRAWVLRKGEALRPDDVTQAEIERLRAGSFGGSPFWLHYQQGLGPKEEDIEIDVNHFPFFKGTYIGKPVVISVDPTSKTNSSSRNAIHVYAVCNGTFVLLDAFAEACTFRKLLRQVKQFASSYRASLILVEETGRGGDLIEELRSQTTVEVEPVKQPRGTKLARFREILPLIRAKKVQIVKGKDSVERVVDELVSYPNSNFDDDVDTLVNLLRRMHINKALPEVQLQNLASIGMALGSECRSIAKEPVRGIAMVLRSQR